MASLTLGNGVTTALGSLPHRDLPAAIEFALTSTAIPTVPTLPRRSPAESPIAQVLVGIDGVTLGQYGALSVDAARLDPVKPVTTDLHHDAFAGFRSFLATAPRTLPAVKWQLVGPVTLGMALLRAGVPEHTAFDLAVRAVRAHLTNLLDIVTDALPDARQLVFIDEPDLVSLTESSFPIAPDTAIDLVSGALAAIEGRAVSGLHCGGDADWPTLIAAGPNVVSLPAQASVVESAGYLQRFLERGGVIAWGAVQTDGPIPHSAERPWRVLTELWCNLVSHGCDQVQLRTQSIITPSGGLGAHTPEVAQQVLAIVGEVGKRVAEQATASRFVLGA